MQGHCQFQFFADSHFAMYILYTGFFKHMDVFAYLSDLKDAYASHLACILNSCSWTLLFLSSNNKTTDVKKLNRQLSKRRPDLARTDSYRLLTPSTRIDISEHIRLVVSD